MKALFILIFSGLLLSAQAQIKNLQADFESIKNQAIGREVIKDIPQGWEKESIIILDHKESYHSNSKGPYATTSTVHEHLISHYSILLQDKAAVEQLAKFYYLATDFFDIKIIKSDGSIISYDKEKLKENSLTTATYTYDNFEDFHHPYMFKNYKKQGKIKDNTDAFKIALSKLEIGDIVQFSMGLYKTHSENFPSIFFPLQHQYPVLHESLHIEQDGVSGYILPSISAPDLNFKQEGTSKHYHIEKNKIEKYDFERWAGSLLLIPSYTVFFNPENAKDIALDENGVPINTILKQLKEAYSAKNIARKLRPKSRKSLFHKGATHEEKITGLYYLLRYHLLYKNSYNDLYNVSNSPDEISQNFAIKYCKLLNMHQINASLVLAPKRYFYDLKELKSINDFQWLIRVDIGDNKYADITPANLYSSPGMEPDSRMMGNKAYLISHSDLIDPNHATLQNTKVKFSKFTDNELLYNTNVSVDIENMELDVEQIATINGNHKHYYASIFLKYERDLLLNTFISTRHFTPRYRRHRVKSMINTTFPKKEYIPSDKYNTLKSLAILPTEEISKIKIINSGRYSDESAMSFRMNYKSKSCLSTSANDIIFNIGALIDGQVYITDDPEERSRDTDIYLNYAKTYTDEINFTIPEGYSLDYIDHLNMNVENESGSFISTATIADSILTIQTKKIYKKNFYDKSKWNEILEFVDAAYDFYRQNIVLIKKSEDTTVSE